MRILVTGITGFVGGHLAEALLARGGAEVVGLSRGGDWPAVWRHLAGRVGLRPADLTDTAAVEAVLRDVRPEQIVHLAGYANQGRSHRDPDAAWAGNLMATRCLYDAVVRWGGRPRILFVGSGMVYGDADAAHDERAEMRPASPYAASKAAADLVSYQFSRSAGLDIVRARPFNHIGPRQSAEYSVASWARRIADIERGQQSVLHHGNLDPRRDFTDVRDVVQAYLLLMERGQKGEAYNIGTGELHAMKEVLELLLAQARVKIDVRQDPALVRPVETKAALADASRLRRETGWAPRYTLAQSLTDILAYWRTVN
jgi:GDP-4-dehydro-6-deoxy-D-mannose reductase